MSPHRLCERRPSSTGPFFTHMGQHSPHTSCKHVLPPHSECLNRNYTGTGRDSEHGSSVCAMKERGGKVKTREDILMQNAKHILNSLLHASFKHFCRVADRRGCGIGSRVLSQGVCETSSFSVLISRRCQSVGVIQPSQP